VTSLGSYTVFVVAFDAADGTGKWAMDGGSDGLDYFFAFSMDPDTNDIYVGGGVYNTPEFFTWGDVKRKNAMRQYTPSSDISSYVGSTKAFTVQIKTTTSPPDCLKNTCSGAVGPQASDVKDGHCYIDRHCYAAGDFAPYPGAHCMKCDPTASATSKIEWTGPDTTAHCFIDGKCIDDGEHALMVTGQQYGRSTYGPDPCNKCDVSSGTTDAYTTFEGGCMLDIETFTAGCYDNKGVLAMTEADKIQLMNDKIQLTADKASMMTTIAGHDATISTLQTDKAMLQADKTALTKTSANKDAEIDEMQAEVTKLTAALAACNATLKDNDNDDNEDIPIWATALVVVVGAMFLLVLATLGFLVSREQQGKPVFKPVFKSHSVEEMKKTGGRTAASTTADSSA